MGKAWPLIIAVAAAIALTFVGPSRLDPEQVPDRHLFGWYCLVTYDVSTLPDWPPSQANILTSVKVRDWLDEHTVNFKSLDVSEDVSRLGEPWESISQLPRTQTPWVWYGDGKTRVSAGPLPPTVDDFLKYLEGSDGS